MIGVEAGKPPGLVHAQRVARLVGGFREIVGGGVELIATVFLKQSGQPSAAAAAADEAEFDLALEGWRGVGGLAAGLDEAGNRGRGEGGAKKLAAGEVA